MSLLKGTVNPLNVVGQRRLSYIPSHFTVVTFNNRFMLEKIDQWIYYNLNSRYCVKLKPGLDKKRKRIYICEIGIEDPKEVTMLHLACPYFDTATKELF